MFRATIALACSVFFAASSVPSARAQPFPGVSHPNAQMLAWAHYHLLTMARCSIGNEARFRAPHRTAKRIVKHMEEDLAKETVAIDFERVRGLAAFKHESDRPHYTSIPKCEATMRDLVAIYRFVVPDSCDFALDQKQCEEDLITGRWDSEN